MIKSAVLILATLVIGIYGVSDHVTSEPAPTLVHIVKAPESSGPVVKITKHKKNKHAIVKKNHKKKTVPRHSKSKVSHAHKSFVSHAHHHPTPSHFHSASHFHLTGPPLLR